MVFDLLSLAASFVIARVEYPRREARCNMEQPSVYRYQATEVQQKTA